MTRVPRILIGCLAALAVIVGGCGDSSSSSTTSGGETTDAATTTAPDVPTTDTTNTTDTTDTTNTTDTTVTPPTSSTTSTTSTTTTTTTAPDPTTDTTVTATTSSTTDTSGGPVVCGDGEVEGGEECDDGNLIDGDGCESTARSARCCAATGRSTPARRATTATATPTTAAGRTAGASAAILCLALGEPCVPGFHAVQCASPGPPFGQASPIPNTCQLATLSVDGSHIALSPGTTIDGAPRHLDAMYTDPNNAVFGFAGDTEDIAGGSQLVAVNTETGALTPVGPSLGVWVMGAAMNDDAELWVTVFDTYERNETTEVSIARVDAVSGEFIDGPTVVSEGGVPLTVWSTHVSDVAFRSDGVMFISANEPGPPPPEPLSRYLEVDRAAATVVSAVEGPADIYAAGMVFVGEAERIVAMDIRGVDDIYILDLSAPPTLNQMLLYPDPIPTNSGTADLAGCSQLEPQ
jgi:cysteine-rich repeat protein